MRNISMVISGMDAVLTRDDNHNIKTHDLATNLHESFVSLQTTIRFAAPEQLVGDAALRFFQLLENIVNAKITRDDYDSHTWCKEVINIFRDPDYSGDDGTE